jgi:hypothetical protein
MPISVKCPNRTCGKTMNVKDQFAGKMGKCPACGTPVKVPAAPQLEELEEEVEQRLTPAPPAAGPDWGRVADAAPSDEEKPVIRRRPAMNDRNQTLLCSGMGALVVVAVSTFFPWVSVSIGGTGSAMVRSPALAGFEASAKGVDFGGGVAVLVLSVGVAVFVAVAVFAQKVLIPASTWTAAGYSILCTLYLLVEFVRAFRSQGTPLFSVSASPGLVSTWGCSRQLARRSYLACRPSPS